MFLEFYKSTYSGRQDNCVEVADLPTGVAVRGSQHPELGFLAVGASEWVAFARLAAGERAGA